MFTTADELLAFVEREGVEFIDVRFCDLPGVMQHFTLPVSAFDDDAVTNGLMFDGSSIRGFQAIHESDMKLMADPATAYVDPFRTAKTLAMNFSILDPFTDEAYSRDPRNVAAKAEAFLISSGIADAAYFGPEAEFYVFDDVRFETKQNAGYYYIDSVEGAWNTGREEEGGNQAYKPRYKGGYFPVPPMDHYADLRDAMVLALNAVGVGVERAHHEVGTAGQAEINYKFDSLLHAADKLMLYKYVIKNVAWANGRSATFMPKPLFGDNGSGMHCHQSLWKEGTPTVNSYRRLVPGFEAPVNLVYSQRNRSAAVRIPVTGTSPKAKRLEYRVPDPSSNPYLAFSAMLMAGVDGIRNKIEPAEPIDKDLYELPPEEHANIATVPSSLDEALEALEADTDYLLEGGVFTPDLVETWIDFKRTNELDPIRLRPHPHEFELYFDI